MRAINPAQSDGPRVVHSGTCIYGIHIAQSELAIATYISRAGLLLRVIVQSWNRDDSRDVGVLANSGLDEQLPDTVMANIHRYICHRLDRPVHRPCHRRQKTFFFQRPAVFVDRANLAFVVYLQTVRNQVLA